MNNKIEQLRQEALIELPLRVERQNVPIADTGDFEGVASIQQGDGGDPLAEVWNSEEHQEKQLLYLAHAGNVVPGLVYTMNCVAEWLERSCQIDPSDMVSRNKILARELRLAMAVADQIPAIKTNGAGDATRPAK